MGVRMGIFRVAKAIKIVGHVLGWLIVAGGVALAIAEPRSWFASQVFLWS
jgi:hypothetical protein